MMKNIKIINIKLYSSNGEPEYNYKTQSKNI